MISSVHLLDPILLELPPGHARGLRPEEASPGPLREEFRVEGDPATDRWNWEEVTRERQQFQAAAAAAAQQQTGEPEVSISSLFLVAFKRPICVC